MLELAIITLSAAVVYTVGCWLIDWYRRVTDEMEEHDEHTNQS